MLVKNDVIVSAFKTDPKYGYTAIELYNTSDKFFDLGQISLELRYATAEADFVCNAKLRDYLRPKSYLTLYSPNLSPGTPITAPARPADEARWSVRQRQIPHPPVSCPSRSTRSEERR